MTQQDLGLNLSTRRTRKAVFLDRDGVINRAIVVDGRPYAPRNFGEFRLMPGARAGVARLRKAGFGVVVVTNQPDVAKKLIDPAELERMNQRLMAEFAVDAVKVCAHGQEHAAWLRHWCPSC